VKREKKEGRDFSLAFCQRERRENLLAPRNRASQQEEKEEETGGGKRKALPRSTVV